MTIPFQIGTNDKTQIAHNNGSNHGVVPAGKLSGSNTSANDR